MLTYNKNTDVKTTLPFSTGIEEAKPKVIEFVSAKKDYHGALLA